MAKTIPDLRQHDLSPDARVQVYRKNTQVVGNRKILARVKRRFATSDLSFAQVQQLSKSRDGRTKLCKLVYNAVREYYKDKGMNHSYSCARARNAKRKFLRELRAQGAILNMNDKYTYDSLGMKPRKDTSDPMESCYCGITQGRTIGAISPLVTMVQALRYTRKPSRYVATPEKPIALTEAGNVYAGDNLQAAVERIIEKDKLNK